MGGAFSTIVSSLVKDVIMPPVGLMMGGVDFSGLFYSLDGQAYESLAAAQEVGAATINYGLFINNVISFIVVALALFFLIRGINSMKKKEESAPAAPSKPSNEEVLLAEIRDLLAKN